MLKKLLGATVLTIGLGTALGTPAQAVEQGPQSAVCKDGTPSYSKSARGTCSGHGGVAQWINKPAATSSPATSTASKPATTTKPAAPQPRIQEYNNPATPCGAAIQRSRAPLSAGTIEHCYAYPTTIPHSGMAANVGGQYTLYYNVPVINSTAHWDYVVAHERCHALGIPNEIQADHCAIKYGGDAYRFGYLR